MLLVAKSSEMGWLEGWKGLVAVVGSISVLLGVIVTQLLKRRTDRESNEIVALNTVNDVMRSMQLRLDDCEAACRQCREDHSKTLIELGKQELRAEKAELDLNNAHNQIRALRERMDRTENGKH